jgi:hypothetical protein
MDPTTSVVTGILENTPFILETSYTIKVKARDNSNSDIYTGGELVYVSISNHCTRSANMAWSAVGTSTSILANEIVAQMTDHGDGTYTYVANLNVLGNATIAIVKLTQTGVSGKFYDSSTISATPDYSNSSR